MLCQLSTSPRLPCQPPPGSPFAVMLAALEHLQKCKIAAMVHAIGDAIAQNELPLAPSTRIMSN